MKRYYKENGDGTRVWLSNIIKTGDRQIINPTREQILSAGYMECEDDGSFFVEEDSLARIREKKLALLHQYDESEEVNGCYIVYQGQEFIYWANKDERNDLKQAVRDCMEYGRTTYRLDLRDKMVSIQVPCDALLQMMGILEVYAVDCFNRTTDHEYALRSMQTEEEIERYEFRGNGYPEKPTFEF